MSTNISSTTRHLKFSYFRFLEIFYGYIYIYIYNIYTYIYYIYIYIYIYMSLYIYAVVRSFEKFLSFKKIICMIID